MLAFILAQAAELISEPPGSLIYALVSLFVFQLTAAFVLAARRWAPGASPARLPVLALGLALLAFVGLVFELLALSGLLDPTFVQGVLPPLARTLSALSLVWMLGLIVFPYSNRAVDVALLLASVLILAAGSAGWALWTQDLAAGRVFFNETSQESVWVIGSLAALALGLLGLLIRRPPEAALGALIVLALAGAYGAHLAFPVGLNAPGGVRLVELVALPLFAALIIRRAVALRAAPAPTPEPPESAKRAEAATRTDPRALAALASLSSAASADELAQLITLAAAHATQAELSMLILPPDDLGTCRLAAAYDLTRGHYLPTTPFTTTDLPDLQTALTAAEPTHFRPQQHADLLRRLNNAVGIGQVGPTLVMALRTGQQTVGALALTKLSTRQDWPAEANTLVAALAGPLAESLSGDSKLNRLTRNLERVQAQLTSSDEARRAARLEADQLHIALETARAEAERLNHDILLLRQEMQPAPSAAEAEAARTAADAETAARLAEAEAEWREKLDALEGERDHYRTQIANLENTEAHQRDRLTETQRRVRELENDLELTHANLAALTTQAAALALTQNELEAARADLAAVDAARLKAEAEQQARLDQLQAELTAARQAAQTAETAARAQVQALEARLAEAEAEAQASAASPAPIPSDGPTVAELQERLTLARQDLEAFARQKLELRGDLDRLTAELAQARQAAPATAPADWQSQLEALQAELDTARQSIVTAKAAPDLHSRYAEMELALAEAGEREKELRAETARLRAEAEAAGQAFEHDLRTLRERVETQDTLLATWQLDYGVAVQQEKRLRQELADAQAEAARLTTALAQAQTAAEAGRATEAELTRRTAEAAEWRLLSERREAERLEAQGTLEQWRQRAEAEAQALAEARAQLDQAHAALAQARAQAEAHHTTLTQFESRVTTLEPLSAELAQTRGQLQALTAELALAHQRLAAEGEGRLAAQQQAQAQTAELAQLRAGLEARAAEHTALQAQAAQWQTELRATQEQLQTQAHALAEAQRQAPALSAELAAARTTLTQTRTQLHDALQLAAARDRELQEARTHLDHLLGDALRVTQTQTELEQIRTRADAAQQAAQQAFEQLRTRDQQLAEARAQAAQYQASAEAAEAMRQELEGLRREFIDLRGTLDVAQGRLRARDKELADANAALAELARQTQTLTQLQRQLVDKDRLLSETQALLPAQTQSGERPFLPEASVEVIASLTQELRQPMSAIVGYSELLLGESVGILGALQRKFLDRIKASCERMEALLDDLINITDIDSGSLRIVPETVDVMAVVEDAIMSCGAQFRDKGINLRLDVSENLPPISADRDAIHQIVLHLLSNAGNASGADGEVMLKVREETGPAYNGHPSSALLLAVRDSGGGIAQEDQPRVFNRFWRADAPLIAGLGETGVGLSVAKALVEAHGGRIWLTTDAGKGSTFTVLLPLDPHDHANASDALPAF